MRDYFDECQLLFSLMRLDQPIIGPVEGLNWAFLTQTLLDNGLGGYAWWRFRECGKLIPDESERILYQDYLVNQFRNMMLLEETGCILSRFNEVGIEVIPLKGIPLLEHVFPLGARQLSDIDLLVDPDEASNALRVLEEMGFKSRHLFSLQEYVIDMYKQRGIHWVPVDLSWKLIRRGMERSLPSISSLKEKCTNKSVAGINVQVLDLEMQITYISGHVALHHDLNFPKGMTDICALLAYSVEPDWNDLENSSKAYDLFPVVAAVMGILNTRLGLPTGGNFPTQWRKMKRGMCRGFDVLLLDNFWLCGAAAYSKLKAIHGGAELNLVRFLFKQRLKDSLRKRMWSFITMAFPTAERIKKMYNPRYNFLTFICGVIHMPLFLIFAPIGLIFVYGCGFIYAKWILYTYERRFWFVKT
jgi:hypothetical protein